MREPAEGWRGLALKWAARALLYPGAVGVAILGSDWLAVGPGLTGARDWGLFGGSLALLVVGAWVGRRYYLATGRRLWI